MGFKWFRETSNRVDLTRKLEGKGVAPPLQTYVHHSSASILAGCYIYYFKDRSNILSTAQSVDYERFPVSFKRSKSHIIFYYPQFSSPPESPLFLCDN